MSAARTIYNYQDGLTLAFKNQKLIATDDEGKAIFLSISSTDLMELGRVLLALVAKQEEKFTSERAGAIMRCDLINELFAVHDKLQCEAFRAIHDKLYALSKLENFDSAAGGFAGAVINVLEVGVANQPNFKREECCFKARIYVMAWQVMPYIYCASMGAMLGFLLMQLFGSV